MVWGIVTLAVMGAVGGVTHAGESAADAGYARVLENDGRVLRERRVVREWMDTQPGLRASHDALIDSLSSHLHGGRRQVITDFRDNRDRIDVPASPLLDYGDAFSYSLWLWLDSDEMVAQTKIVSHAGVATGKVTLMGRDRRLVLLLRYDDGSELAIRSVAEIPVRRWVHVGISFERGTPLLFLDGTNAETRRLNGVAADSPLLSLPDQPLYLGGLDRSFPGRMDEVRIYARALAPEEFARLAAADDVDGGLIAHWPLDDGAGGQARDVSGSGLDGVVGASVVTGLAGRVGTAMGFSREASVWTDRLRDLEARIAAIERDAAIDPQGETAVSEVMAALSSRSAVLVHYAAHPARDDTMTAWVVTGTGVTPVGIALDGAWRDARAAFVDELAGGRLHSGGDARARKLARAMARTLWDPVEDVVGPADEVWLRLTPELHAIPFAALVDRDGAFLAEGRAFARCGPVGELPRRLTRGRRAPARVLAIANPDFHALGDGKAARMPGAAIPGDRSGNGSEQTCVLRGAALHGTEREAAMVAKILLGAGAHVDVFEWDAAQEKQLDDAVGGADVVHVATHGYRVDAACLSAAPSDPLFMSGVILAGAMRHVPDGYRGGDEGLLSAAEVAGLDLSAARVVVWSACATATGVALAGEPLCGLAAAAWIAGAGVSVATLWPVSDADMPESMAVFYAAWLAGDSPARALRSALLYRLESTRRARGHAHPAYWAAMVLEGE